MDEQLKNILETLLLNIEVLNNEIMRLGRSEQFKDGERCFQLIEKIRDYSTDTLRTLQTIERKLYARDLLPPKES